MGIEFKLDIDNKKVDTDRFKFVNDTLGLSLIMVSDKETRNGHHIIFYCEKDLSDTEICLIQTFLGSDYKREVFNFLRIKQSIPDWNILFKKKIINGKVVSYEK